MPPETHHLPSRTHILPNIASRCCAVAMAILLCILTPKAAHAGDTATLTLGGTSRPNVVLYLPQDIKTPALNHAIDDLADHLQKIIGDRVSRSPGVHADARPHDAVPIHIRINHLHDERPLTSTSASEQGFTLTVTPDMIQVMGQSEWGTVYGIYELLEQMGVRWLYPGDWGLVLPDPGPVSLKIQETSDQPIFTIREIHQFAMRAPTQFADWARRSRQHVCGYSGHSALILKYKNEHPEWFALVKGKRMNLDSHPKLCHSNQDMVKAAIEQVLQQIDARATSTRYSDNQVPIALASQVRMISISPTDGGGFCECEPCQKMGSISDRLQIFANTVGDAVAEKHPGYKVGYYGAYSQAQMPPTVKASPNVIVFATTWQKSFFLPLDNIRNQPFRDKIAEFSRMCPDMGIRDFDGMFSVWWGWGPMSLINAHAADYPWYLQHGVKGFITEALDHWAAGGQSYYITTKLWWNPHADVEALKRDFVNTGFREAAEPMWRFYERINEHQTALSESVLIQMRHDLEEARRLARRADVVHRIDMLRLYMLLNDTLNRAQAGQATDEQLQQAVRIGRSLTGMNIVGKGMVQVIEKLYTTQTNQPEEIMNAWPACTEEEQQQILAAMTLPEPAEQFAPWQLANDLQLKPLSPQATEFDPSMTSWLRYGPMTMLIHANAGQVVNVSFETGRGQAPITYEILGPTLERFQKGSIDEGKTMSFTASQQGIYTLSIATPGTWVRLNIDAQHVVYRAASAQDRFHPFRSGTLYFYVPKGTKRFAIVARTFTREKYSLSVWGPDAGEKDKPLLATPSIGDSSFRAHPIDVPQGSDGKVWRLQLKGDKKELFLQGIPPLLASQPERLLILEP